MVTIKNNSFGISAKWINYFHPNNSEFSQQVFWHAWLNNNNEITVTYTLINNGKRIVVDRISLNGSFENTINTYVIKQGGAKWSI